MMHDCPNLSFCLLGAAVAKWLSSWLAEQEDRGSIPGLTTWIFRDWLSPASMSRYGWKIAESRLILKTTNQPKLAELTVDEYVNKITSNIMQSAEVSIPNKMVTIRPRDPPWMNNTIRRAIREKNKYHRSAKRINTNDAWIRYRVSRNKVTDLVRNSKTDYFKKLASSLNQGNLSSKQWWKVTKQFLKQNKGQWHTNINTKWKPLL